MLWHEGPFAALDMEATGVDPATERVIDAGRQCRNCQDLFAPGGPIAVPGPWPNAQRAAERLPTPQ